MGVDQVTHLKLCNRYKGEIADVRLGKLAKPEVSNVMRFIASDKCIAHILRSAFQKHITAKFLVAGSCLLPAERKRCKSCY